MFTKYLTLYPLKKITTRSTLNRLLKSYFVEHGKPERILSDHGTQFTAKAWRRVLEEEGIQVLFSSIRHPQSNPVERSMREIGKLFRTFCSEKHQSWAKYVPDIQTMLNITTHSSTGFTPRELHLGTPAKDSISRIIDFPFSPGPGIETKCLLADRAMQDAFKSRIRNQKGLTKVELQVGDLVLLRVPQLSNALRQVTHKFFHLYQGPYTIDKCIGKNAYRLTNTGDGKLLGVYNRSNLRKYYQCA